MLQIETPLTNPSSLNFKLLTLKCHNTGNKFFLRSRKEKLNVSLGLKCLSNKHFHEIFQAVWVVSDTRVCLRGTYSTWLFFYLYSSINATPRLVSIVPLLQESIWLNMCSAHCWRICFTLVRIRIRKSNYADPDPKPAIIWSIWIDALLFCCISSCLGSRARLLCGDLDCFLGHSVRFTLFLSDIFHLTVESWC